MRTGMAAATRPDARSPRFRRDPFVRDGVFDLGRATAPRMTAPQMLPSATLKASPPTTLLLTRLNSPPHTIAVYASPWSSPSKTQHSLPDGRYPLPGPDSTGWIAPASWRTSDSVWRPGEPLPAHSRGRRRTGSFAVFAVSAGNLQ